MGERRALTVRGVTKRFGATLALDRVGLEIEAGEVHGLLGHNGSGKSTLIKALAGVVVPEDGTVEVPGTTARFPLTPASAHEMGLRFVHQNLGLVPSLTVGENLLIDRFTAGRFGRIDWRELHRTAQALLDEYGVPVSSRARTDRLRPSEQAQLAVVRAVADERCGKDAGRGRVVVLDEPTVFLPRKEVAALFALVRRLVARGDSVLLVSHRMDEILGHTDRVTVLRNGRRVVTTTAADTSDAELVEHIVGHAVAAADRPAGLGPRARERPLARVRAVSTPRVRDVDLDLRPGEVLGLTGLAGAGHEDLVYALFGCAPHVSGTLELNGAELALDRLTPAVAMRAGIGLVPADRGRQGIAPTLSLAENLTVTTLSRHFRRGVLSNRGLLAETREAIREFGIRPDRPAARAGELSGGNQQRLLIAKWLRRRPRLLLLHEPTQGIDVGARAEIWSFIRAVAAEGAAVLCATTDHEELTTLADRVAVFARGRLVRTLDGADVTEEKIAAETLVVTDEMTGGVR